MSEWGYKEDGVAYWRQTPLNSTHVCTREELGLEDDRSNARFMPLDKRAQTYVDFYRKKFICLEPHQLFLFGDFASPTARQLNVDLVKCTNRTDCKTDE